MVDLLQGSALHGCMNKGVLGQQHNSKGVPVQPGDGMKSAVLPGTAVIARHQIGQCSGIAHAGWMNQHSGRLVHRQQVPILIQHSQFSIIRRIRRSFLVQHRRYNVSRLHQIIRVPGRSVYKDFVLPFQPVHQPGGHFHFPAEKRGQPFLPCRSSAQFHAAQQQRNLPRQQKSCAR